MIIARNTPPASFRIVIVVVWDYIGSVNGRSVLNLSDEERLDIARRLQSLGKSKFRSSFHLRQKDIDYINKIGLDKIKEHAVDFISERLAPANIPNDGKQTPMRNHPVFIAQHATATCCRGCLSKWHHIMPGHQLTDDEFNFVIDIIMAWIITQYSNKSKLQ